MEFSNALLPNASSSHQRCRCGAHGHGLVVDLVALGLRLDLMILRVFSNLNDSMILILGIAHHLCTTLHALQPYLAGRAIPTALSVPKCAKGAVGRGLWSSGGGCSWGRACQRCHQIGAAKLCSAAALAGEVSTCGHWGHFAGMIFTG